MIHGRWKTEASWGKVRIQTCPTKFKFSAHAYAAAEKVTKFHSRKIEFSWEKCFFPLWMIRIQEQFPKSYFPWSPFCGQGGEFSLWPTKFKQVWQKMNFKGKIWMASKHHNKCQLDKALTNAFMSFKKSIMMESMQLTHIMAANEK